MRPVFSVLIALAMLIAPFAMQTGSAQAAMPSGHQAGSTQATQTTHCSGEQGKADTTVDHSCCAAMCAPMTLPAALAADLSIRDQSDTVPPTEQYGRNFLAKLPTPPPRDA